MTPVGCSGSDVNIKGIGINNAFKYGFQDVLWIADDSNVWQWRRGVKKT
ncbi:MAG: hypothetical protein IMF17_06855 [Proteobacteria bacterium]|nr:hypothetical protein [Pseudomonadota bacterium]